MIDDGKLVVLHIIGRKNVPAAVGDDDGPMFRCGVALAGHLEVPALSAVPKIVPRQKRRKHISATSHATSNFQSA